MRTVMMLRLVTKETGEGQLEEGESPMVAIVHNVHQCSPMLTNVHQCSPMFTNVHQCSPMFTGEGQSKRKSITIYAHPNTLQCCSSLLAPLNSVKSQNYQKYYLSVGHF